MAQRIFFPSRHILQVASPLAWYGRKRQRAASHRLAFVRNTPDAYLRQQQQQRRIGYLRWTMGYTDESLAQIVHPSLSGRTASPLAWPGQGDLQAACNPPPEARTWARDAIQRRPLRPVACLLLILPSPIPPQDGVMCRSSHNPSLARRAHGRDCLGKRKRLVFDLWGRERRTTHSEQV